SRLASLGPAEALRAHTRRALRLERLGKGRGVGNSGRLHCNELHLRIAEPAQPAAVDAARIEAKRAPAPGRLCALGCMAVDHDRLALVIAGPVETHALSGCVGDVLAEDRETPSLNRISVLQLLRESCVREDEILLVQHEHRLEAGKELLDL